MQLKKFSCIVYLNVKGKIFVHDGTVPPIWNPLALLDFNNAIQYIDKLCNEVKYIYSMQINERMKAQIKKKLNEL